MDQLKIKIHQALTTYTADEFNTFCLLHFQEVYFTFGQGQSHQARTLMLLEHCVRKPEEWVRLHQLLLPEAQPVAQPAQHMPMYQLLLKHYFDLRNVVDHCCLECDGRGGLFVFAVQEPSQQLIDCLGKRVIEHLGPTTFASERSTVNLSYKNTKAQLERVRRLKSVLQGANVVLPFIIADQATFDQLWDVLQHDLDGIAPRRCIVLIGLLTELNLPQAVIQLTPQPPSKFELLEWAIRIGLSRSFPSDTIELWKTLIWTECTTDNQIDFDLVYAHMDFAIRTLSDEGTSATLFHDKLKERSQAYAASAD